MSLKLKLVSIIASLCLVVVLLSVGVWAVQQASVSIGGSVSFIANDVYCDVTGSVSHMAGTAPELKQLSWSAGYEASEEDKDTWKNNPLTFDKQGTDVTYLITIKNNSDERYIDVTMTDNSAVSKITHTITFDGQPYQSGQKVQVLKTEEKSFLITFSIAEKDKSVLDSAYSFQLLLQDENYGK